MRETYIIGDTHANLIEFADWVAKKQIKNFDMIHVGDFGVGFPNNKEVWLKKINTYLKRHDIHMHVIRGNHDDPSFFDGNYEFSNLSLLQDNIVKTINGADYFFSGGGISVDRFHRKEGWDYWSREPVTQINTNQTFKNIDYVITHNCPRNAIPVELPRKGLNNIVGLFEKLDSNLISDLNNELDIMDSLQVYLSDYNIKKWYFGHYHKSMSKEIDGILYRCLNISKIERV